MEAIHDALFALFLSRARLQGCLHLKVNARGATGEKMDFKRHSHRLHSLSNPSTRSRPPLLSLIFLCFFDRRKSDCF